MGSGRERPWKEGQVVTARQASASRPGRALTIAGSDSGGGAGIQADLKTFTAYCVYGMSAVTAITAQNTLGVRTVTPVPPDVVAAQIAAVAEDIGVDASKTGMLGSAATVARVAKAVRCGGLGRLVVDPVMMSKDHHHLLDPDAVTALRCDLVPLATVLTPNLPEAATLLGCALEELADAAARRDAAVALHALGPRHVVLKGGHVPEAGGPPGECTDIWYDGQRSVELRAPRVDTRHTHGTGCTFSAAITACLARGLDIEAALESAKSFITWAIAHAPGLGAGSGPVNHLWGEDRMPALLRGLP